MERNKAVLDLVQQIRKKHPRAGTCKLPVYIRPELERASLTIGRDALNRLLRENNLLVKKTKRFHITTNSRHYFYKSPNLLKDIAITHSEQAIVSDITYLKTDAGHAYLALATDPYGW
jgi:transposase InsO family protein